MDDVAVNFPEARVPRRGHPVRETEEPCKVCGHPIVPGGLYVVGPPVTHVWCRVPVQDF